MTVRGYFFLCFAGFWNADCRQIGRLCVKSLKSLRKTMEITDKNPIDKIGKKGYNIRKSGKADGIMQTGCRTNGYATPCETAFSARACRYAVYGISDTAVAVSVFVLLCLCAVAVAVVADLIVLAIAGVGILVLVLALIVRICKGRNRFTERNKHCAML